MKIPFLALVLAGLSLPLGAQEPKTDAPKAATKNALNVKIVTVDDAEKLMKDTPGLQVVDVRTPEEFDHEHIKGAINLNVFDAEFDASIAKLDQSKPILVHCAAGGRAKTAVEQMEGKVKFPVVYNMSTGFSAWKKAGKPFESKPLPKPDAKGLPGDKKAGEKPAEKK